jgi:hypothetical protein
MATTPAPEHRDDAQRREDFSREWLAIAKRVAKRDRAILDGLAAFDRGEWESGRDLSKPEES